MKDAREKKMINLQHEDDPKRNDAGRVSDFAHYLSGEYIQSVEIFMEHGNCMAEAGGRFKKLKILPSPFFVPHSLIPCPNRMTENNETRPSFCYGYCPGIFSGTIPLYEEVHIYHEVVTIRECTWKGKLAIPIPKH